MKRYTALLCLMLFLSLCLSAVFITHPATASTSDGVVEVLVFSSPNCPDCEFLNKDLIPRLQQQYGSKIKFTVYDFTKFDQFRKMLDLESTYGRSEMLTPQVYIGRNAMIGTEEIKRNLEKTIQEYAAARGVSAPAIPEKGTSAPVASDKPVSIAYFYRSGCRDCDAVSLELANLQKYGDNIVVRKYDMSKPDSVKINEVMGEAFGVPPDQRGEFPALVVGSTYLAGKDLNIKSLQAAITKDRLMEVPRVPWEVAAGLLSKADKAINTRFSTLALPTVVAAGLVDGLNPCSFTVIIFLIAYLAFIGKTRKEVLAVGGAYTLTVFIVYTLIGIGLFSFISAIGANGTAGIWLAGVMAGLTALLGIVAIFDYFRSRKTGKVKSRTGVSTSMTRRIHESIRKHTNITFLVGGAVIIGFVVTIFELGCTGQVYLPTITFVAREGSSKSKAVTYLLMYNLAAVIPLIIVFLLVFFGTSSERLVEFGRKHAPGLTLLGGVAMLALSVVLFVTL